MRFKRGDTVVWCPTKTTEPYQAGRGMDCILLSVSADGMGGFMQSSDGYVEWIHLKDVKRPSECHSCRYRLVRLCGGECPGLPEKLRQ